MYDQRIIVTNLRDAAFYDMLDANPQIEVATLNFIVFVTIYLVSLWGLQFLVQAARRNSVIRRGEKLSGWVKALDVVTRFVSKRSLISAFPVAILLYGLYRITNAHGCGVWDILSSVLGFLFG